MSETAPEIVRVFHAVFHTEMPPAKWQECINLLPPPLHAGILRYHRWQDRHRALIGKLLLRKALQFSGIESDILTDIKTNDFGRPSLNVPGDFNISHSGNHVVCASSSACRLGIDIEETKTINFDDFQNTMTAVQWRNIQASANSTKAFFRLWALKESVIKADGKGLAIPLTELETDYKTCNYNNMEWFLTGLNFDEDYAACIATSVAALNIEIVEVVF
jgi:4'-phosphopantetheinyl transferase